MPVEKIYLTRHASRLSWVTDDWHSPTGTPRDPPISPNGERQSQQLADYLASLPLEDRPTAIFASPYYRCLQTTKPIATTLRIPVYLENGVSSWYHPVVPGTGLHPIPLPAATLAASFPEMCIDAVAWPHPTWIPPRMGETMAAFHERCEGFIRALISRVEQLEGGRHKNILLLGHAPNVISLTRVLLRDKNLDFRVAPCTLTTLARRGDEWELLEMAQGKFLTDGLEKDWGYANVEMDGDEAVRQVGEPGTENEVDENFGLQTLPI